jgi:hypothetical protein
VVVDLMRIGIDCCDSSRTATAAVISKGRAQIHPTV